ncbi:MAG: 30S ribosomal protein S6 [Candidatus Cloacimonetes bacterium]|nr:30S ribosomal protein S6 [Candidatus Cloacimonadota bacterium]MCF7813251.1 30S ribosomal protein S6 [Candidatus Cloacimonadota bacterium]MCF7867450.1 30S ribosomal protein S6 [Candidatus Cloacimonadota bacterium]MCF7882918.1 30S ribosomal protein S6 [Candidatus Cloacimonadota bacterium]
MKKYESMIIVSPSLSEDGSKQINETIQSFIKDNGGEVLNTDEWGKKRLAYEIQDEREGIFFVNYYTFDPAKIDDLDRLLKLNENVLRYNILVK